jgi:branched-chain amino acid transport system permease protein
VKKIAGNLLIVSLGVLLSVLVPIFAPTYYTRIAIDVLIYAYLGAAWNILGGYTGQGSFGHAAFFGLGAYSAALFFVSTKLTPWIGLLIGAAVAIGFALLMGYLCFKFGLSGHFFFLGSIAFAESLRLLFNNLQAVGGSVGIYIPFTAGNSIYYLQFSPSYLGYYYIFLILLVGACIISYKIKKARLGYYLRTIRTDEILAESIGISTMKYKMWALVISALLTSICGSIFAFYMLYISPDFVMNLTTFSVLIVVVVIVGGIGTWEGPLIGAIIVMPILDVTSTYFGEIAGLGPVIAGAVLLAVALGRPAGFVNLLRRSKE